MRNSDARKICHLEVSHVNVLLSRDAAAGKVKIVCQLRPQFIPAQRQPTHKMLAGCAEYSTLKLKHSKKAAITGRQAAGAGRRVGPFTCKS